MEEVKVQGVRIRSFLEFNDLNVRACEKKSHYLRGLDGRGQFLTISISFYRRALYNDNEKHSNFKFQIYGFILY